MSKDTIYRQVAIDALKEAFNPSITNFVKAKIAIDNLPSAQPETMYYPQVDGVTPSVIVQPERKKGEWIEFDSDEDKYDIIKCSCCKHIFTVDSYHWSDIGFVKDDFNFCPNCGARMEKQDEQ